MIKHTLQRQESEQSVNSQFVNIVINSIYKYQNNIGNYIYNQILNNAPIPNININFTNTGAYINLIFDKKEINNLAIWQDKKYGYNFTHQLSSNISTFGLPSNILYNIDKIILVASFHNTDILNSGSVRHNRFHFKSEFYIYNKIYKYENKIKQIGNKVYRDNNINNINEYFLDYFDLILSTVNISIEEELKSKTTTLSPPIEEVEDGEIMNYKGGSKNKKINYKNYSVLELKSICKNNKIKNYSKLNKADLIKLLKKNK